MHEAGLFMKKCSLQSFLESNRAYLFVPRHYCVLAWSFCSSILADRLHKCSMTVSERFRIVFKRSETIRNGRNGQWETFMIIWPTIRKACKIKFTVRSRSSFKIERVTVNKKQLKNCFWINTVFLMIWETWPWPLRP